jgi:1-acyl-sn-glycerol-3-phosphate acyltransferase
MIRTIFVVALTFAYTLLAGGPVLIYSMISGDTDLLYNCGILGVRFCLWLAGVSVEVGGRENIPARSAAVFMPNHQSNADPPAVVTALPPVLVMTKQEFFRVPVLGHAMRLRGFIPVDRKNSERGREAVEQAVRSLKAGNPFLVFPEGTRSLDGRLQAFKKGAFIMAIKSGTPIVPISISGTRLIMQKGKAVMRPGRVRITIHPPIATTGCTLEDIPRLQWETRQAIMQALDPAELPLPEGGEHVA